MFQIKALFILGLKSEDFWAIFIKDTPKGRQALYDDLNAVGSKCLGIGKDTKHAVVDATKRVNRPLNKFRGLHKQAID